MDRNDCEQGGAEQVVLKVFLHYTPPNPPSVPFSPQTLCSSFLFLCLFKVFRGKKSPVHFLSSFVLTVDTEHVSFDIYFDMYL